MEQTAELLAGVLERQIEHYNELKRLALEERKALSANDLKLLGKITADVQAVTASNYRLESERKAVADRLASESGLSEKNLTLERLTAHLGGAPAERLHALRQKAVAAIQEAQRQNRINVEMLNYCSGLADSVLKGLVEPISNQAFYSCTGESSREVAPAALFDHGA